MRDRIGPAPLSHGWLLRLPPGAPFRHHLRQALVTRNLVIFSIAYVLQTCVSVTAWFMAGRAALEGRFDAGTVFAWTFLLLMLAPLGLVAAWSQGVFAVGAGGLLKLRLLFGALRLEPDETRHQGIGQHLARVIESETVESLALAGVFYALATAVELLMASAIFIAASLVTHLLLLVITVAIMALLGWRSFERRHQWTGTRLEMTNDLVERMVGHRTRLAQEPSSHWHTDEDQRLDGYVTRSARMDRADLALLAIPRAWLIIAVLGLAPSFLATQNSSTILAVGLGAILLAYGAFAKLTSTFSYAASAVVGWKLLPLCQRVIPCLPFRRELAAGHVLEGRIVGRNQSRARAAFDRHVADRHARIHIERTDVGSFGEREVDVGVVADRTAHAAIRDSAARWARPRDARRRFVAATCGRGSAISREPRLRRKPRVQPSDGPTLAAPNGGSRARRRRLPPARTRRPARSNAGRVVSARG